MIVGPGMGDDRPGAARRRSLPGLRPGAGALSLPDLDRVFPPGIHPTAVIDPTADVARGRAIGPYCVVGAGTVVGAGSRLGPHVVLGPDVAVGRDCLLYPQVTVREGCRLGDRVILHAGVVIGTDGFGYLPGPGGLQQDPPGGHRRSSRTTWRSAPTPASTGRPPGETVIGAGTKIDNLVQIGHNVQVGRHCALSAQTGISGSCVLGDGVIIGGQVGMARPPHGSATASSIGAKSGVTKDVPAGQSLFGYPGPGGRARPSASSARHAPRCRS